MRRWRKRAPGCGASDLFAARPSRFEDSSAGDGDRDRALGGSGTRQPARRGLFSAARPPSGPDDVRREWLLDHIAGDYDHMDNAVLAANLDGASAAQNVVLRARSGPTGRRRH